MFCSRSYIRPPFIVHSCSQYLSIFFPSRYLFYIHYSDHVCFFLPIAHRGSALFTPRIFNSTRFFYTPAFTLVESRRLHNFLSRLHSSVPVVYFTACQPFFCRVHRPAVSQWNVIVSTDMAPDSPLGAASFFVPVALSTLELRHFTAAHLNISPSKSGSCIERLTAPS